MINKFTVLLLPFPAFCSGQSYLLKNEKVVFSFDTRKGKRMVLAKDSTDMYLVYRFGTKDSVEFEFPAKNKTSWAKFKYSYYLRGGGIQNEGMDLNYIYFVNSDIKYVVYNTYHSVDEKIEVGIKVIDISKNKTVDIKGDYKTRKGTMADFRDNSLLEVTDELFE